MSCLIVVGCATPKATSTPDDSELKATSFWQPHLLYLQASVHPRLYVEVDAVQGCEPSDATLNKLRNFLGMYCQKPGGIEIVRSDVIPTREARGHLPAVLAGKFLNGPPQKAGDTAPAFIYVLYYDGALSDEPVDPAATQLSASTQPRPSERNAHPRVVLLPYPAMIFMNTRYSVFQTYKDDFLIHEAGHVLGLAGIRADAKGGHCLDPKCLMNAKIHFDLVRLLTARDPITQHQLCERCLVHLTEGLKQPPPANLRFVGPVLVRSEAGYHVLTLPSHVKLLLGDLTDQDCWDYVTSVRAEIQPADVGEDASHVDGLIKETINRDPAKTHEILNRAKADPLELVRLAAAALSHQFEPE